MSAKSHPSHPPRPQSTPAPQPIKPVVKPAESVRPASLRALRTPLSGLRFAVPPAVGADLRSAHPPSPARRSVDLANLLIGQDQLL
jgi:hypothetical protein